MNRNRAIYDIYKTLRISLSKFYQRHSALIGNIMLAGTPRCKKALYSQYFMAILFINSYKSLDSLLSIPPLCSTLPSGGHQWHFNDQDKANCLNDYFLSMSTVNDEHIQLPPFAKLTNNSLSQNHCNEHEIENIIEVLNPNKASDDYGINHKMLKGVYKNNK